MYELADLLEGMRDVYFRWLTACFDDLRKQRANFIPEAVMNADGNLVREGPLSLPFRCDAMVISPDGTRGTPTLFPAERRWNFSPAEFEWDGVTVSLSTCHWEAVRLTIWGEPQSLATAVKTWFEAAFEPPKKRDGDQIQEVVHDIFGFVAGDQIVTFTADFGTMPVAQVFVLIDHLRAAGATRVELSMP